MTVILLDKWLFPRFKVGISFTTVAIQRQKIKMEENHMKILKIMFVLGIVAGLAATSAKGCDGLVLHPGSTTGSCQCNGWDCGGSAVVTKNDYNSCGGDGALYCMTQSQQVGSTTPCSYSFDSIDYYLALAAYAYCEASEHGAWCGDPPQRCNYVTCTLGTSTPIYGNVAYMWSVIPCCSFCYYNALYAITTL